jgi:hypothetical protein
MPFRKVTVVTVCSQNIGNTQILSGKNAESLNVKSDGSTLKGLMTDTDMHPAGSSQQTEEHVTLEDVVTETYPENNIHCGRPNHIHNYIINNSLAVIQCHYK